MPQTWRLALNQLAVRKGRTALIVIAVTLAASLVSAVSTTISSAQGSFEHHIDGLLGATDARIIHQFNGRFDDTLLETVHTWPGVIAATSRLSASLTLVHSDDRRDPATGDRLRLTPQALGVDFDVQNNFKPIPLLAGNMPTVRNEIIIDPMTARVLRAEVGDTLIIQRFGAPIELVVAGIYDRQSLSAVQRPKIRIDRSLLAEAVGKPGQLSAILILLDEDIDVAAFCARHGTELDASLELEPADIVKTGFNRRVVVSRYGLVVASILTFMSASFIIVTGLTTAVTEQQRELATIRCIGGGRLQLAWIQMAQGIVVGAIGGAIGVPLGIGLSAVLIWWYRDLMPIGLIVNSLGVWLALSGSLLAGVLGAAYPAWLAARVPPLQALTSAARPVPGRAIVITALIAGGLIFAQLGLLMLPNFEMRFWMYAFVGAPLVYLGYFIASVPVLVVLTRLVARPLSHLIGLPAGMLDGAVRATPYRHGFTAGALMVGMSLLVSTWSNGQSLMDDWIGRIRFADGFAYRTTGISAEDQKLIADLPFVESTCPIGYLPVSVLGQQVFGLEGYTSPNVILVGFDPTRFFSMNNIDWIEGDPETAIPLLEEGNSVIVADRFLVARDIGVGDTIRLGAGDVEYEFTIVGVVTSPGMDLVTSSFGIRSQYLDYALSCVFINFDTVVERFDNDDAYMLQTNLADDVSDEEASAAIQEAVPGVLFHSGRWIAERINEVALALLTVQSAIAAAALLLASIGVGNVIMANIHARRFEYGVMRAIGTARSILIKLIIGEALVIALTAAVVGTILGLHLASVTNLNYRDLAGIDLSLTIPIIPTLLGALALAILATLAALPAALRIARAIPSHLLAAGRNT